MSSVFEAKESDPSWLLIGKAAFGVGLALAAPLVAFSLAQTILTASRSQGWPEATATIVKSEVTTSFPVGARGAQFDPQVEYRYEVGNKPYTGARIALRSLTSQTKGDADRVAEKYAAGTRHPVFYDPTSPSESLLERGTGALTYVGLGIPLVMILLGPLMAREQIRELRRRRSPGVCPGVDLGRAAGTGEEP